MAQWCTTESSSMSPPTHEMQLRNQNTFSGNDVEVIDVFLRRTISSSDRPFIERMVEDAEREFNAYQAEFDKLSASLALLEHKRDESKKKLLQCRSLFSPVHRLPPETLGDIFTILVGLHHAKKRHLRSKHLHPALVVSSTCRRWRDIAISTPSVWSSISIRCQHIRYWERNDPYGRLHSLTRLFLERSQRCPLKLFLELYPNHSVEWPNVVPILETLVQHSERWHTVELLDIERSIIAHKVFAPIAGRLPVLTDLTIFGLGSIDKLAESDGLSIDLFSHCPALTSISYESFGPLTPQTPLPWGQIRSIRIKNSEVIRVAPLWTNVQELTFKRCCQGAYTGDHLAIPSVTRLSVTAEVKDEADFAFRYLTLPQLSSLELLSTDYCVLWPSWDERHITDFLTRSACTLTSLSLKRVPTTDEVVIRLLQVIPTLKSLQLEEKSDSRYPNPYYKTTPSFEKQTITRQLLQRLTIDTQDASSPLLPKLANIGLVLHDGGLAEKELPAALLSRWMPDDDYDSKKSIVCIKSIDIVFIGKDEQPVEILEEKLQPLRNAGVWMSLRAAPEAAEEIYW